MFQQQSATTSTPAASASEEALRLEISRIIGDAPSFSWGVEQIAGLLRREAGGVIFRAETGGVLSLDQAEVYEFLDSARLCKMLYTIPLIEQGRQMGWLVAAFADPALALDAPQRLARFAAQQLGPLLVRSSLRAGRANPVEKLEDQRGGLAGNKLLLRALELLVGRHRLSVAEAKDWLEAESRRTGRAPADIAERLVKFHTREAKLSA